MIRAWVAYISAGVPPNAWWWESAAGAGKISKSSKKKAIPNDGVPCLLLIAEGIASIAKLSLEEANIKKRAVFVDLAEFLIGCLYISEEKAHYKYFQQVCNTRKAVPMYCD